MNWEPKSVSPLPSGLLLGEKTSNLTGLDDGNVSPQTEHGGEEMWILQHPEPMISQGYDAHGSERSNKHLQDKDGITEVHSSAGG